MRAALIAGWIWCWLWTPAHSQSLSRYAYQRPLMGTEFRIVLYAADSAQADAAAQAAFARIDSLNSHLSDYLPDSELNRLCATAGQGLRVPVSDDLWRVLVAAQQLARHTGGAFDVSVGPLSRLWRRAMRQQTFPDSARLAEARSRVGYQAIRLYARQQAVELRLPDMRLDLGGIAKGYAGDEALAVLAACGIRMALVDAGGDLSLGDPPPGRTGWEVAVSLPGGDSLAAQTRLLANCGIATSGDTYRYLEHAGRRYSHLIDPRTGMGMSDHRQVTVLAATGMMADAWASAASILDPATLPRLLRRRDLRPLGLWIGYPDGSAPAFVWPR
ncbi:MAG: FAD:protein FMN transferase ApbE [Bacteroidia bacterium]